MDDRLQLVIRTPHEVVLDQPVRSARIPTESGLVGLRPRQEPMLLAVEPGLILYHLGDQLGFAATAGGVFECDREAALLCTPFAVVDTDADRVLSALDAAMSTPGGELAARRRLGELEEHIVQELRHRPSTAPRRHAHA